MSDNALRGESESQHASSWTLTALIIAALLATQAAGLWALGRLPIAQSGTVEFWHGAPNSGQSQHIADWYTFTHIEHGLIFYLVLAWLFPRWSFGARLIAAFVIEGAWELFENTDFVINRYRQSNLAQGYMGDTIVNSISDTAAMALGFVIASRLTTRGTVALIVAIEVFLVVFLRDNLTLNILNLAYPFEFIQQWQGAGKLAPQ